MKRSLLTLFALLSILISSVAFAAPAMAGVAEEPPGNSGAVAACRAFDEAGDLDEFGVTFGECVNLLKGPSNENSNNFIAALCGAESTQEFTETTNKGQCIKVVRELFSQQ